MDLKLFLLVGLCCMLRASAQDRDKAMQAKESGQLRRLHSRFGRNYVMPQLPVVTEDVEAEPQMNEIINAITREEEEELEPGMSDNKWHLPLENQLLKYLNRPSRY